MNRWGKFDGKLFEPWIIYLRKKHYRGTLRRLEPGFIWGKTWEYCWFKGTVILPKAAEGKRIVMNLDAGGESTVFVNGKAFGNYRAAWVDEPHQFIEDNCLAVSGKKAISMRS